MARTEFQIDVQDGGLNAALNDALAKLEDPQQLMENIGAIVESNVAQRFLSKTDPAGIPWAPLAASTLARYAKEDDGTRAGSLLDRTGRMLASLTHNAGRDYAEIGFSSLTDSGKWQKADLHEFGTTRMPRRGMLTADPEAGELGAGDRADILAEVEAYLTKLL